MSVSLWRWTKACDTQPCVGDCDHCSFDSTWCEKCKFYVEDGDFCGHPLLDKDLDGGCEWHESIEGESL